MVVAGAYVAYYGYYELRLLNYGGDEDDPMIDAAIRFQTRLQDLMPNTGNYGWYVLGAVLLLAERWRWRCGRSVTVAADRPPLSRSSGECARGRPSRRRRRRRHRP